MSVHRGSDGRKFYSNFGRGLEVHEIGVGWRLVEDAEASSLLGEAPVVERVDDTVQLSDPEQHLLETILRNLSDGEVERWPDKEQRIFCSLFNKLVD